MVDRACGDRHSIICVVTVSSKKKMAMFVNRHFLNGDRLFYFFGELQYMYVEQMYIYIYIYIYMYIHI